MIKGGIQDQFNTYFESRAGGIPPINKKKRKELIENQRVELGGFHPLD
jgi:hypothetical protein